MTPSQRLRLVIALGAVNLVLAIAAFGLAGTMNESPGTALRTPGPSASAGPVAAATPAPTSKPPESTGTPGPSLGPTPAATEVPAPTLAAVESGKPVVTPGPVATHRPVVTPAPVPTDRPPRPSPSTKPLPSPTPVAPVTNTERGHPPCPGSIDGPPGKHKSTSGDDRPCRGGEGKGDAAGAGGHARTIAHGRVVFEAQPNLASPIGLVEPRVRAVSRRRSRSVGPRRRTMRG